MRLLEAKHQGRSRIISESPVVSDELPFDRVSRWIERERVSESFLKFLQQISEKRRGSSRSWVRMASGRTRCLEEVAALANLRGYEILMLRGNPGLKQKQFAALGEARKSLRFSLPACSTQEEFAVAVESLLKATQKSHFLIRNR